MKIKNPSDIFEGYYSFSKLNQKNPYYQRKAENYALLKNEFDADVVELKSLPIRATIQTTDFCNLNCIMCQIHSQREKHNLSQMKSGDFDLIVKKLFPTLVEIHPTNIGEPLISPWFDYLCDKCYEYGVLLDITSNGTVLTEEKIRKILPSLLDIKISFDGIEKETFERIRKNADYETVRYNIDTFLKIRNASECKATISLQMTLFNFNYKELPKIIEFAKEKGIDRVKAYHVFSYSKEIDSLSLMHNLDEFEETRKYSVELAEKLGIALELAEPEGNPSICIKDLFRQKCRLPWGEIFIDNDGSVYPCHTHNHIAYGNIFSESAVGMWNSSYAKSLRLALVSGNANNFICENCGNNFVKYDENQFVPYNKNDYLFEQNPDDKNVHWGKRCKQFLLNR